MFIGEFTHSIDVKGRMALPAKFRSDLEKGAVVTRGIDQCLFVYPLKEWTNLATRIAQLPLSQAQARAFSRLMLAGAMDVEIDRQGRIMIPEYLRGYASLSKRVIVAGLYNRLEIWNEDVWKEYKARTECESQEISEKLGLI